VLACASGAANAVDKVFGYFRQIVIDNVGDILYVDSARGEIGRHQNAVTPLLKAGQCADALRLGTVAVNHCSMDAFAVQVFGDSLGAALGAREN